jgi:hypothetical protein
LDEDSQFDGIIAIVVRAYNDLSYGHSWNWGRFKEITIR